MVEFNQNREVADLASSVATAVTGAQTPDNVKVDKPSTLALISIAVTALLVAAGSAAIVSILTWGPWLDTSAVNRIRYVGWMGIILTACVPVVVAAFASPWIGKVKASAGTNAIEFESRGHQGAANVTINQQPNLESPVI